MKSRRLLSAFICVYLWLGTEFGLFRFDGVRSVPWDAPAGDHLPGNFIDSLLAARDGRLWIGATEGLASWKDGKLTHYPELAGQSISALVEDRAVLKKESDPFHDDWRVP